MILGFPVRLLAGLVVLAATVSIVAAVAHDAIPGLIETATKMAAAFR